MRLSSPRRPVALLAAVVLTALLAACGSSAARTDAASPAGTAPPATLATHVPAGTTLRVGDQLDYLQLVLSLSGQDKGLPYKVDYGAFIGGPPMLQAFQAGAIDTGFVGSTPLIFAQAGDQGIAAVAGWASQHSSYTLLTAPGETGVKRWADLKGKKVAFQQGTAGEAVVLEALASAGLTLSDITPVNVVQTQVTAALQGHSADAGVSVEPLTSVYLAKNPTATQAGTADAITDRSSFLIATRSALQDPAKAAALGDYIARLVRGFAYLRAHPELVAQAVYVKQYGLTPARAAVIQQQVGPTSFLSLPGSVQPAQQHLADLFHSAGEIPATLDVAQEFDTRYNQLVQQVQAHP